MTRKQAVLQAIEILSNNRNNDEICKVLNSILEDLPMSHWSDKAIFDAFDQYILDNNRLPSRNEIINNPKLPTHPTVKNRFGITLQEFYKKYYNQYIQKCPSRVYHYQSVEYWIENFKEQYAKLDYPTQNQYDLLREQNTPSSRHLVKLSETKNWNELLAMCGFKILGQNYNSTVLLQQERTKFTVTSVRNTDINEDQIKAINESLQSIINGNN